MFDVPCKVLKKIEWVSFIAMLSRRTRVGPVQWAPKIERRSPRIILGSIFV